MKHFIRALFAGLFLLIFAPAQSQNSEFRWGLIGKLEFNRLKIETAENLTQAEYEPGLKAGAGLYAAVNLSKRWFIDASVLLTRAKYSPDFKRSDAVFIDADVRFTQVNLCLNLVLNPNAQKVQAFAFGGTQALFRRWGEERYTNDIIPDSYWPVSRTMMQAGMGLKCAVGPSNYLQPFVGLRHTLEQQLVYDVSLNQVFAGLVFCHGIKGKAKPRYNKCPADF